MFYLTNKLKSVKVKERSFSRSEFHELVLVHYLIKYRKSNIFKHTPKTIVVF